jgi:pimeloyl-ACP methyl ester carboxylesterase
VNLEQWRQLGRRVDYHGHDIALYEGGRADRPTMLLIHGFPTAAWDWHRLWPALADSYRLLAPDLIGYGFSAKPRRFPYSISAQADLCEAIIADAGVSRFHVLAHDYGDTVAQELLARRIESEQPDGMRSLCLLNGGVFPERHRPRVIQTLLASRMGPLLARLMSKGRAMESLCAVFGPDTRPDSHEQEVLWQLMDAHEGRRVMPKLLSYIRERELNRERWVGALAASPIPLLFINGLLDPVSGAHMVDRWRELLPQSPVQTLPGIGHYPQLEDPDSVLAACQPFFSSISD